MPQETEHFFHIVNQCNQCVLYLPIRNTLEMRLSKNQRTFEELAPFVQLMSFEQLAITKPLNLHIRKISEPSNNWRPSKNWRPSYNQRTSTLVLVFFTKKNKMIKFPTKMKQKIGAPKGRQLYGAPKRALIMPNSVILWSL